MDSSDEALLLAARFFSNMKRVDGLIGLTLPSRPIGKGPGSREEAARDDIGRAVVVFLHATFEDMLRTLARQRLVAASPEILTRLPLRLRGEKEKFLLGSLAAHRGKTIDELLKEAVDEYLDREPLDGHHQNLFSEEISNGQKRLRSLADSISHFKFLRAAVLSRFPDYKQPAA